MSFPQPLRVGVLLAGSVQVLDMSPIDLFGMLRKEYLIACKLPAPLVSQGLVVDIQYIAESGKDSIVECTASAGIRVTAGLDDEKASPDNVDVLMIPGPDPSDVPSENVKKFIRAHAEKGNYVLTVCTGIFPAGYSGILKGKKATGPRPVLGRLKSLFPDAKWEDRRWTHDGRLWCAAGITNGLDMTAAFLRNTHPGPLVDTVVAMADVGDRPVEYSSAVASDNAFWLWQILRSLFRAAPKASTA